MSNPQVPDPDDTDEPDADDADEPLEQGPKDEPDTLGPGRP